MVDLSETALSLKFARVMSSDVSIVVCCHNSAHLLPDTLAKLSDQKFSSEMCCEVIVVDNASTDATVKVARESWPANCAIDLRIVQEPELGLSNARLRGISEAQYSLICFVDDDNRLAQNWVEIASNVMTQNPKIGACGGQVEAECEITAPDWFKDFQSYYAVGRQAERGGDITDTRGYLWGAGLCLRRCAWNELQEQGFNFLLSGRKGGMLTAGEDAELCYALRLAGWRLWYEPDLKMHHFMTPDRLNWSYLRRVSRGFGTATTGLDLYEIAIKGVAVSFKQRLQRTWSWQVLATIKSLLRKPLKLLRAPFSTMEGDPNVLIIESHWGRLVDLMKNRANYVFRLKQIKNAKVNPFSLQNRDYSPALNDRRGLKC
jgi:glycosyltransferase involved in cell wall biosynthesis